MIFLINSSYNADEKEKAPQEYYLWSLNQLKKINTMQSDFLLSLCIFERFVRLAGIREKFRYMRKKSKIMHFFQIHLALSIKKCSFAIAK